MWKHFETLVLWLCIIQFIWGAELASLQKYANKTRNFIIFINYKMILYMVMGCDIIDSWAMDHFGKLRHINVSIIPGNYLDWYWHCVGIALFTFGNEMVSSAIKNWTRFSKWQDKFVLFKEVIFTVWFKNKNLNLKQCDPCRTVNTFYSFFVYAFCRQN
jgi:hypothetical protein